jgi:hypothetical protein
MPLAASADWGEGDTLEDALSELRVGFDDTQLDWLVLPGIGVVKLRYTYFKFANERTGTVDEHPVYCIDPTRGGAYEIVRDIGVNDDGSNTATYIRGEKVGDPKYRGILAAGYPHMRLEGLGLQTKEEGYYATKLALWMYIRGNDPTTLTINPAYGDSDPAALRVRAAAIEIYNNGISGSNYEPLLTLTGKPGSTATLDANGEYYVQEIEVYANAWIGTDTSASGDVQLEWASEPPSGTIVLGSNGEDISSTMTVKMNTAEGQFGHYGKVTVKFPAAEIDAETFSPPTLNASAILPNSEIYVAYAKVNKDKYQRYLVERDPKIEITASFVPQISIDPTIPGTPDTTLHIRKVQTGTNIPLAGAVFEIRDPDGKLIYSLTTDESGVIDVPLSVVGNYTITEITPPQYHLLPERRTQSVYVRYNETAEVTFVNAPYGTLRIVKRDAANGAPLGGAAVQIKHIVTNTTREGITDSSGSAVFEKLPVGAYEIVEAAAPDGYAIDSTVHTVNVTPLTEGVTSFVIANSAKPGLTILKIDLETAAAIEGVTFGVWREAAPLGTYTTDRNGMIELPNLPPGTYVVKEVATVHPWVLDPTPRQIQLEAGDGIKQLIFANPEKTGMYIVKLDALTLKPLAGARFRIERVGGGFAQELDCNANGEINITHLDPGVYEVTETVNPYGLPLFDYAVPTPSLAPYPYGITADSTGPNGPDCPLLFS